MVSFASALTDVNAKRKRRIAANRGGAWLRGGETGTPRVTTDESYNVARFRNGFLTRFHIVYLPLGTRPPEA